MSCHGTAMSRNQSFKPTEMAVFPTWVRLRIGKAFLWSKMGTLAVCTKYRNHPTPGCLQPETASLRGTLPRPGNSPLVLYLINVNTLKFQVTTLLVPPHQSVYLSPGHVFSILPICISVLFYSLASLSLVSAQSYARCCTVLCLWSYKVERALLCHFYGYWEFEMYLYSEWKDIKNRSFKGIRKVTSYGKLKRNLVDWGDTLVKCLWKLEDLSLISTLHKNPGIVERTYNLRVEKTLTEGSLGLAGQLACFHFSDRPCLKNKQTNE